MFRLAVTLPRPHTGVHVNLQTLTVEPDVTPKASRVLTENAVIALESATDLPLDAFARTRPELVTPETLAAYIAIGAALSVDVEAVFLSVHNVHAATATETAVRHAIDALAPAQPAPKPFNQARRDERADEVLAGRAIVGYGSTYLVQPSDPSAAPYTVTLDGAGHCDCGDARHRVARARLAGDASAACKHLVAVRAHVRTAATVAA